MILVSILLAVAIGAGVLIWAFFFRDKRHKGKDATPPSPQGNAPAIEKTNPRPLRATGVPEWAGEMKEDDFHLFLQRVAQYFQGRKMPIEVDAGRGEVKIDHPLYEGHQVFLANLSGMCRQIPQKHWAAVINNHFQSYESGVNDREAFDKDRKDFDKVKSMILPRLYAENFKDMPVVGVEQIPETFTALVFDLPTTVTNVTQEDLDAWGKSREELIRLSFHNLRAAYPPVFKDIEVNSEITLKAMAEDHFFNTTYALQLETFPEIVTPHGVIFGIPNRGNLVCYPIRDLRVVNVIGMLIQAITGMFRDGPGSVSPHLYWYREGQYTILPFKLDHKKLEFFPPEEFVQILNGLKKP